jgi:hypothetical protein
MTKEQLSIWLVIDNSSGEIAFTGTFKQLKKFTLDNVELMNDEDDYEKMKKKLEKGDEVDYFKILEEMDFEVSEACTITKDDFKEKTIEVGIYFYINDEGEKVYDVEEMTDEFLNHIRNLK